MIPLLALMWLLVAHFVGDFVLQSDWMAQNKSKNWRALGSHVAVYGLILCIAVIAFVIGGIMTIAMAASFAALNATLHFVVDAVTSRINARLWQEKRVHDFFVGVGADQLIHALTLGFTLIPMLRSAA